MFSLNLQDLLTMEKNKKVLIVEDEMIIALVTKKYVENMGYEVTGVATNSTAAVDAVREKQPDLVLMDIMINGEVDGIDTMDKIRSFSEVPVVYLTGNSDAAARQRAQKTGFSDFLVKPIDFNDLKSALQKILL
jgi:CheY-like chemotaxis protein